MLHSDVSERTFKDATLTHENTTFLFQGNLRENPRFLPESKKNGQYVIL